MDVANNFVVEKAKRMQLFGTFSMDDFTCKHSRTSFVLFAVEKAVGDLAGGTNSESKDLRGWCTDVALKFTICVFLLIAEGQKMLSRSGIDRFHCHAIKNKFKTVRKVKMLYFQNERRYGTGNL